MGGALTVLAPAGLGRLGGLYRGIAARGWQVRLAEVGEPRWLRLAWRLATLRPTRAARRRASERLDARTARTAAAFERRSRASGRVLASLDGPVDLVLQIGGMQAPAWPRPSAPYALFCDCTVRLGEGRPYSGVEFPSPEAARRWYALEGALYRDAHAVFCASDFVRRSLLDDYGVDPGRAVTIGEGCNLPATGELDGGRAGRAILFVGYEFERKGGDVLLAAFRQVRARVPRAELWIAGPRTLDHPLPEGARLCGAVGPDELARLYAQADLFALPTRFEPFGLVLLEAMEHGVPCVASDVCAIPEIVADGETGRLVPEGDVGALADALVELLHDPARRRAMGERGRRRVRERFTWTAVAERFDAALERLARRGPPMEERFHERAAAPPAAAPRARREGAREAGRLARRLRSRPVVGEGAASDEESRTMNAPVRVLHFVDSFNVGGAERQVLNLVGGLAEAGFEVHLACFKDRGELAEEAHRVAVAVREFPLRSLRRPDTFLSLLELARYLRRQSIDVVHTTSLYANVFGVTAAWAARTPVVVAAVRDMGPMWTPGQLRAQRLACRRADVVVTNAHAVAERLRDEGYDPGRLAVVRNGIVAPAAPPRGADPELRRQLGVADDARLVGVVCRFHRIKRLEDFVDAAALLAPTRPDVHFLVVGPREGSEQAEYAREIEERAAARGLGGRLILTGARDDVPRILATMAVSVLPSASEGLSNTLLESMAAGTPVVATAVGGTPEIVADGETGLLVPPAEPSALAGAIRRLLDAPDLAAALARAARASVEERFGVERMVRRTAMLYLRLLAGTRRARGRPAASPGSAAVGSAAP